VIEREREDGGGRDKDREVGVGKRKAGRQIEKCRKSENKCREGRRWKPTELVLWVQAGTRQAMGEAETRGRDE